MGKYQGGTITADLENGGLDLETTSGNIVVASIDVSGSEGTADVTLTSAGTITDSTASDDSIVNIIASSVTLDASSGIGISGAGDIDTTAEMLLLSSSTSGGIYLQDSDAVSLSSTTTSSGDILVSTLDGILTVSGAVSSSSGNISLTGDDGVAHTATGDLSTGSSGTININATAGDVTHGRWLCLHCLRWCDRYNKCQ